MELVVDTNCLISALILPSKSRELICSFGLSLYAPEEIITETLTHKEEIIAKSKISESDFDMLINVLLSNIKIVPEQEFVNFKEQALSLVEHPEDSPFIALALLKNSLLWSDDKALKRQSAIRVVNTSELVNFLEE